MNLGSILQNSKVRRFVELTVAVAASTITTIILLTPNSYSDLASMLAPWAIGLTIGTVISTILLLLPKYYHRINHRVASLLEDFGLIERVPNSLSIVQTPQRRHYHKKK